MTKDVRVSNGVKYDKSETMYGKKLVNIPSNKREIIKIVLLIIIFLLL